MFTGNNFIATAVYQYFLIYDGIKRHFIKNTKYVTNMVYICRNDCIYSCTCNNLYFLDVTPYT